MFESMKRMLKQMLKHCVGDCILWYLRKLVRKVSVFEF